MWFFECGISNFVEIAEPPEKAEVEGREAG